MANIEQARQGIFPEFPFQSGVPIQDLVINRLKATGRFVVLPTIYTQSIWLRSDVVVAPHDASSVGYPNDHLAEVAGIIADRTGIAIEESDSWDVSMTNRQIPLPRAVHVSIESLTSESGPECFPSGTVIVGQRILEYDYMQRAPDEEVAGRRLASGLPFLEAHFWVAPNEDVAKYLLETASSIDGVSVAKATHLPTDGSIPHRKGWSW